MALSLAITGAQMAFQAFQRWQAKRGIMKAVPAKYRGLAKAGLAIAGLVGGGLAARKVVRRRRTRRRRRKKTTRRTYRRRKKGIDFEEIKELLMIKMLLGGKD